MLTFAPPGVVMIAFSCSYCGVKLGVKDEFAGRLSKCPTCKQPLVVPAASATSAFVPPQQIDGADSSLAKVGLGGGITLSPHDTSKPGTGSKSLSRDPLAGRRNGKERYVIEGEIARGGMGAVLRAVDCDIRREVAVKYLLDGKDPNKQARFIEEAQINGQLEHPNIVPVYDLGVDAQKRPFIMMKMVKGRSLKDVLDQLRDNPRTAEKEWSLGRLLNILVNVCHALSFAHSRGVIHRDLKPANIMLGDFGEVYVMDWGLAKVLGHDGPGGLAAAGVTTSPNVTAKPTGKVVTSREPEADLTQEGAVLGTPVYMPPEQAAGQITAIDQRSDVYSLGALLYEMLTFQPPVVKEGGQLGVLMQVVQGEIIPPEKRAPKRSRAGKVPRELAAIAMKALAKEKEGRYPTAEALRQDIERFQEGRSVSAKADTVRELAWKLVKRNKGASLATAAATVVIATILFYSFRYNYAARVQAAENLAAFERAQADRLQQGKDSVPAYLRAAHLCINQGLFDDALAQANSALEYDRDHAEARLLRCKVLLVKQRFKEAEADLEELRRLHPDDEQAGKLLRLCRQVNPTDPRTVAPIVEVFLQNHEVGLALGMGNFRDKMLAHYRERIEKAWAGLGSRLKMDAGGKLDLNLGYCGNQVTDLTPLHGMPLTRLDLFDCRKITDLKPLTGMPLVSLNLMNCGGVRDLTPLKGMVLTNLSIYACGQVRDLTPLQEMPLTSLSLGWCPVADLTSLKEMPLTALNLQACGQVQDLTPLQGMTLGSIILPPRSITRGLEVIRHMKSVQTIGFHQSKMYPAEEFWKRYDAREFDK
jgi:serine/threonine protein kinase